MFANLLTQNIPKTLFARYVLKVTLAISISVLFLVLLINFSKLRDDHSSKPLVVKQDIEFIPIVKKSIASDELPKNESKNLIIVAINTTTSSPTTIKQTELITSTFSTTKLKTTKILPEVKINSIEKVPSIKIREAVSKEDILNNMERIVHIVSKLIKHLRIII